MENDSPKHIDWTEEGQPSLTQGNSFFLGISPVLDDKEITSFGSILSKHYGLNYSFVLKGKTATKQAITEVLNQLSGQLKPIDQLLLYYVGETQLSSDHKEGYWLTYGASLDKQDQLIGHQLIYNYLSRIPANRILLLSDTCFVYANLGESNKGISDIVPRLPKEKSISILCSRRSNFFAPTYAKSHFSNSIQEVLLEPTVDVLKVGDFITRVGQKTRSLYAILPNDKQVDPYTFKKSMLPEHTSRARITPLLRWMGFTLSYLLLLVLLIFGISYFQWAGFPQMIMDSLLPTLLLGAPLFATIYQPLSISTLRGVLISYHLLLISLMINWFYLLDPSQRLLQYFGIWFLFSLIVFYFLLPRINQRTG